MSIINVERLIKEFLSTAYRKTQLSSGSTDILILNRENRNGNLGHIHPKSGNHSVENRSFWNWSSKKHSPH
jgi:hypothetical protein